MLYQFEVNSAYQSKQCNAVITLSDDLVDIKSV